MASNRDKQAEEPATPPTPPTGEDLAAIATPPRPRAFQKLPNNFGGMGTEGEVAPPSAIDNAPVNVAPEPDAPGYIRQEEPDWRPLGQSVQQGVYTTEPQPLRQYTPEQMGIVPDPTMAGMRGRPADANAVRCQVCGSSVGVFYRDPFTGNQRHQNCPGPRAGAPNADPRLATNPNTPRQVNIADAKKDMQPPDEVM